MTNVTNVVYLVNYRFKGGPGPTTQEAGDVNLDDVIDLGDAVFLLNYLFKGGPSPDCP